MANAPRDNNREPVVLVLGTDGVLYPLYLDSVTHRVLIDVTLVADVPAPALAPAIDNNRQPVSEGVTANAALSPSPLLMQTATKYLWVDIMSG